MSFYNPLLLSVFVTSAVHQWELIDSDVLCWVQCCLSDLFLKLSNESSLCVIL